MGTENNNSSESPITDDPSLLWLSVHDIVVIAQTRELFEDEENTLADLAESIKKQGVLQPLLVRPLSFGRFELVAGERRLRASKMAGLTSVPAYVRELNDEEAEDAQFAENIHRLNHTQIEEAKKLQRDLEKLGSVEAVMAKHQKSKAWFSKKMSLLSLTPQATRLVSEHISADSEVIMQVKTIEAIDPEKAKTVVDTLKRTRGKEDARVIVAAAKADVKPGKPPKVVRVPGTATTSERDSSTEKIAVATPLNKEYTKPSAPIVSVFPSTKAASATPEQKLLVEIFNQVFNGQAEPDAVVKGLSDSDRQTIETNLQNFFDEGAGGLDIPQAVLANLRKSIFGKDGAEALSLLAFFQGVEKRPSLDLMQILESVKRSLAL
jgi:ParB family chromosome partitioning protein